MDTAIKNMLKGIESFIYELQFLEQDVIDKHSLVVREQLESLKGLAVDKRVINNINQLLNTL